MWQMIRLRNMVGSQHLGANFFGIYVCSFWCQQWQVCVTVVDFLPRMRHRYRKALHFVWEILWMNGSSNRLQRVYALQIQRNLPMLISSMMWGVCWQHLIHTRGKYLFLDECHIWMTVCQYGRSPASFLCHASRTLNTIQSAALYQESCLGLGF